MKNSQTKTIQITQIITSHYKVGSGLKTISPYKNKSENHCPKKSAKANAARRRWH